MSIDLVINAPETPARTASIKSMQLSMEGDAQGWLDLFPAHDVVADEVAINHPITSQDVQ